MAVLVATQAGLSFVPATPSTAYDPVYGVLPDVSFLWSMLPSFYSVDLDPESREPIEAVWGGMLQLVAGQLLEAAQTRSELSLSTFPLVHQKKWVALDLWVRHDMTSDPGLTSVGNPDRFVYNSTWDRVDAEWVPRAGLDAAAVDLAATLTEDSALGFDAEVRLTSASERSTVLFGFFGDNTYLTAGLVRRPGDSNLRPAIVHVDAAGNATLAYGSDLAEVEWTLALSFRYEAATGVASLTAVRRDAELASGSATTGDGDGVYSGELVDLTASFDEDGVEVGDTVTVDGVDRAVTLIEPTRLVVSPATLPASAAVAYEVRASITLGGLSLSLPADAADPTFSVDRFGTLSLPLEATPSALFPNPGRGGPGAVGHILSLAYVDPVLPGYCAHLPMLQDAPASNTVALYEGRDFTLRPGSATVVQFREVPTSDRLWAEYAAVDEGRLGDVHGFAVGIQDPTSEQTLNRIQGMIYAQTAGPTVHAVVAGACAAAGVPLALEDGVVTAVNTGYSGTHGRLTIGERSYLYPLNLGTELTVGDSVKAFDPLCPGIEYEDYLTNPTWFHRREGFHELQKYHAFELAVDISIAGGAGVEAVLDAYRVMPLWKEVHVAGLQPLRDSITPTDDLGIDAVLTFTDVFSSHGIPVMYDQYDVLGDGADTTDWLYDAGMETWETSPPALSLLGTALTGTFTFTAATATGTGTAFLSQVSAGDILAVGTVETGTADTVSGSFTIHEVGAFTDVSVGARFLVGADDATVLAASDDTLTLSAALTATATGASWTAYNPLSLACLVDSVSTDTSLAAKENYPGSGVLHGRAISANEGVPRYDRFDELSPEESFTVEAELTLGAGTNVYPLWNPMSGSAGSVWVDGSELQIQFGIGSLVGHYLQVPNGSWCRISSVDSATLMRLAQSSPVDFTDTDVYYSSTAVAGLSFTNGSATVPTDSDLTGSISADDWLQVVPTPNRADPSSGPAVQVQSINATTITLTEAYTGTTLASASVVNRGSMPTQVELPTEANTDATAMFDISGPGSTASSTLTEPS
jgi:hypothetical protein